APRADPPQGHKSACGRPLPRGGAPPVFPRCALVGINQLWGPPNPPPLVIPKFSSAPAVPRGDDAVAIGADHGVFDGVRDHRHERRVVDVGARHEWHSNPRSRRKSVFSQLSHRKSGRGRARRAVASIVTRVPFYLRPRTSTVLMSQPEGRRLERGGTFPM